MAKYKKLEMSAEDIAYQKELDAERAAIKILIDARAKYEAVLARCQAVQAQFPKLYLLDECISAENAGDGLRENEGIKLDIQRPCAVSYDYLARNIENDMGVRMADLGLVPSDYGIRF